LRTATSIPSFFLGVSCRMSLTRFTVALVLISHPYMSLRHSLPTRPYLHLSAHTTS
jgi:hypothetical protein